jgi:cyclase
MIRPRVIPCLLLRNLGLVKTIQFRNPTYLGDPINIVKIFNDKEVDELIFLDITATIENKRPPLNLLTRITSECFMPLCYGGGVHSLEDMKTLFSLGIEKIAVNSHAVENPSFIRTAADLFGSQSVIGSIDTKKNWRGRFEVFTHGGRKAKGLDPVKCAAEMERQGAGELLLTSIDHDGTMGGYDIELVRQVTKAVGIPVIACGGAGKVQDLAAVVQQGGASAAAAGSMFVFQGPHHAVLISYPSSQELQRAFGEEKES